MTLELLHRICKWVAAKARDYYVCKQFRLSIYWMNYENTLHKLLLRIIKLQNKIDGIKEPKKDKTFCRIKGLEPKRVSKKREKIPVATQLETTKQRAKDLVYELIFNHKDLAEDVRKPLLQAIPDYDEQQAQFDYDWAVSYNEFLDERKKDYAAYCKIEEAKRQAKNLKKRQKYAAKKAAAAPPVVIPSVVAEQLQGEAELEMTDGGEIGVENNENLNLDCVVAVGSSQNDGGVDNSSNDLLTKYVGAELVAIMQSQFSDAEQQLIRSFDGNQIGMLFGCLQKFNGKPTISYDYQICKKSMKQMCRELKSDFNTVAKPVLNLLRLNI
jgi:hypothetical protein